MNTKQQYKLIDGTFSAADAAQILLSLIDSKINYHKIERLSHQERFGRDLSHSEQRLAELQQVHQAVRELCETAEDNDNWVKVNGWIEVTTVASRAPRLLAAELA